MDIYIRRIPRRWSAWCQSRCSKSTIRQVLNHCPGTLLICLPSIDPTNPKGLNFYVFGRCFAMFLDQLEYLKQHHNFPGYTATDVPLTLFQVVESLLYIAGVLTCFGSSSSSHTAGTVQSSEIYVSNTLGVGFPLSSCT